MSTDFRPKHVGLFFLWYLSICLITYFYVRVPLRNSSWVKYKVFGRYGDTKTGFLTQLQNKECVSYAIFGGNQYIEWVNADAKTFRIVGIRMMKLVKI